MDGGGDTTPIITARSLGKMYGPHMALEDVNLEIPPGAVGVLGPNGAGKSTLFKCLLGLITTTSGEGTVLGYDIRTEGDKIRSRIGYMPEYDALDPDLSAIDQGRYAGELVGMNPAHATRRAHEVLQYVGRVHAHQFSGVPDLINCGEVGIKCVVLRHVADARADLVALSPDVVT